MTSLKEHILEHEGFLDNNYLDSYVRLIERNRRTVRKPGSTNMHHIVPRSWFRINKQPVNDSLPNLVNLTYRDHVLAHYFLCLCTTNSLLYANELALFLLTSRKKLNLSERLLVQGLPLYNNIYEDYKEKKSSNYVLYEDD